MKWQHAMRRTHWTHTWQSTGQGIMTSTVSASTSPPLSQTQQCQMNPCHAARLWFHFPFAKNFPLGKNTPATGCNFAISHGPKPGKTVWKWPALKGNWILFLIRNGAGFGFGGTFPAKVGIIKMEFALQKVTVPKESLIKLLCFRFEGQQGRLKPLEESLRSN